MGNVAHWENHDCTKLCTEESGVQCLHVRLHSPACMWTRCSTTRARLFRWLLSDKHCHTCMARNERLWRSFCSQSTRTPNSASSHNNQLREICMHAFIHTCVHSHSVCLHAQLKWAELKIGLSSEFLISQFKYSRGNLITDGNLSFYSSSTLGGDVCHVVQWSPTFLSLQTGQRLTILLQPGGLNCRISVPTETHKCYSLQWRLNIPIK